MLAGEFLVESNIVSGGGAGLRSFFHIHYMRSGSSLKLDDSDGSVTLYDEGGVSMKFDGGGIYLLLLKSPILLILEKVPR